MKKKPSLRLATTAVFAVTSLMFFLEIAFSPSVAHAATIFTNGRSIVHKGGDKLIAVFPDVALTPGGNTPIPLAYPATPFVQEGSKGVKKTKTVGTKTAANYRRSAGDEAGVVSVEYSVVLAAGEEPRFQILLVGKNGEPLGPEFDVTINESGSELITFDLTGVVVEEFDIVLALTFLDTGTDFNSMVEILDIDIEGLSLASVPEPSTLMLMGIGLVGLGWMGRRKKRSQ